MTEVAKRSRFSAQLLLKNTSLNLIGQIAPILVALISIPVLIRTLGAERFGVLMLAWMCLGYFNLFDFGLSRALTKSIAERIGTENEAEIPTLFWTTFVATIGFALIGSLTMALASGWMTDVLLKIPEGLETESHQALLVIACSLPFVITSTSFRGLLEATQDFVSINMIQIPMGVLFYLCPLVVAKFSVSLPVIILSLVACRIGGWFFFLRACKRNLPDTKRVKLQPAVLPSLLKFGGWVTVSNLLIPIIAYADRFLIGVLVSISAVTYYSTPYEIVNKLWIFPGAVMSVVFPAIASYLVTNQKKAAETYFSAIKLLFGVLTPLTFLIVVFSKEGLLVWAGADLAAQSSLVMQILGIAIFFNCLGMVPNALLDALGYPVVSAISHLIQLPLYIGALYYFVPDYGLTAAALIWVVRNLIDTSTLFLFARKFFSFAKIHWTRTIAVTSVFIGFLSIVVYVQPALDIRVALSLIFILLYPPWLWFRFFSSEDRRRVLRVLMGRFNAGPRAIAESMTRKSVGIGLAALKPDREFLISQLKSFQDQTYENWICVVSLDPDYEIDDREFEQFKSDTRFIWTRNLENSDNTPKFEYILRILIDKSVDMVAFADQADIWYPNKLEVLVNELHRCVPGSLVHSNMHIFSKGSDLQNKTALETGWEKELRVVDGYAPLQFLFRNTVTGASCLFDVSLAKVGCPISKSVQNHDQWFALLASILGEVRPVNEILYACRRHGQDIAAAPKFEGIFYKPPHVTWWRGFRLAISGWKRIQNVYEDLEARGLVKHLPRGYRFILFNPLIGTTSLFVFAFLFSKDDPPLARALLGRGIGAGLSFIGAKGI